MDGIAVGIGGPDNDLADGRVFRPGAVDVFKVIGPVVAGVVALAVEGVGTVGACGAVLSAKAFPRNVLFRLIAFFPGDEMYVRVCEDLVEDVIAIDAAVHNEGEDALRAPLETGAKAPDEGKEAATQIGEVIGAFEVNGVAAGSVDIVAVDELVGPADGGAPAFEDGLVAGVVLGVGVEVEVGALRLEGGGLSLLVVPAEEAGLVARGGEGLEAGPLEGEGSGGGSDELAEILPVQKLGLLDVDGSKEEAGEPLLEEGFRRGDGLGDAAQGFGKEEESGVIVMTGFAGLQV